MKAPDSHIIQRSHLKLKVRDGNGAYDLQTRVTKIFHAEVLPLLEQELDRWGIDGEWITIDRLQVDLGSIDPEKLETELPRRFLDKLRDLYLRSVYPVVGENAPFELKGQSKVQADMDALLQFLETGYMSWEVDLQTRNPVQLMDILLKESPLAFTQVLRYRLLDIPMVAERVALQFDAPTRLRLLETLCGAQASAAQSTLKRLVQFIEKVPVVSEWLSVRQDRRERIAFAWILQVAAEQAKSLDIAPADAFKDLVQRRVAIGWLRIASLREMIAQAPDRQMLVVAESLGGPSAPLAEAVAQYAQSAQPNEVVLDLLQAVLRAAVVRQIQGNEQASSNHEAIRSLEAAVREGIAAPGAADAIIMRAHVLEQVRGLVQRHGRSFAQALQETLRALPEVEAQQSSERAQRLAQAMELGDLIRIVRNFPLPLGFATRMKAIGQYLAMRLDANELAPELVAGIEAVYRELIAMLVYVAESQWNESMIQLAVQRSVQQRGISVGLKQKIVSIFEISGAELGAARQSQAEGDLDPKTDSHSLDQKIKNSALSSEIMDDQLAEMREDSADDWTEDSANDGRKNAGLENKNSAKTASPEKGKGTDLRIPHPSALRALGIYVENAGLVLLNPFLKPCFEEFGWFKDGEFVDMEAHENAVLLTAYMGAGENEISEAKLPLAKLLCGMELEQPVRQTVDLSQREYDEVDALLTAANEYWKKAGKLTPDQFRGAFLAREGRLKDLAGGWELKVDRQTHDILLEFLPWSFATIKLPWMSRILTVDW